MGEAGGSVFDDTLPIDERGSAYLPAPTFFFGDLPRLIGGGAINAARGSSLLGAGACVGVAPAASLSVVLGMIGGGANGFATSAGSSPGKIQRLSFSS